MKEENIFGYVATFENGEFKTIPILEPFQIVSNKDMETMKKLLSNGK